MLHPPLSVFAFAFALESQSFARSLLFSLKTFHCVEKMYVWLWVH